MLNEEGLCQWGEDLTGKKFGVLLYIGPISGYGLGYYINHPSDYIGYSPEDAGGTTFGGILRSIGQYGYYA